MRVWVTRAQPGAERTAAQLRRLGHEPIVAPLLKLVWIDNPVSLDGVGALIFTSRNGVAAFARRSEARELTVFTVGDATAEAARSVGFLRVESAGADVKALAALLNARAPAIAGDLLYIRPVEPAEDLPALFPSPRLRSLVLYETVETAPHARGAEAVLVQSPKAARILTTLLKDRAARIFCISEKAAAPLREAGFENLSVAPFPEEAALLKLLRDS